MRGARAALFASMAWPQRAHAVPECPAPPLPLLNPVSPPHYTPAKGSSLRGVGAPAQADARAGAEFLSSAAQEALASAGFAAPSWPACPGPQLATDVMAQRSAVETVVLVGLQALDELACGSLRSQGGEVTVVPLEERRGTGARAAEVELLAHRQLEALWRHLLRAVAAEPCRVVVSYLDPSYTALAQLNGVQVRSLVAYLLDTGYLAEGKVLSAASADCRPATSPACASRARAPAPYSFLSAAGVAGRAVDLLFVVDLVLHRSGHNPARDEGVWGAEYPTPQRLFQAVPQVAGALKPDHCAYLFLDLTETRTEHPLALLVGNRDVAALTHFRTRSPPLALLIPPDANALTTWAKFSTQLADLRPPDPHAHPAHPALKVLDAHADDVLRAIQRQCHWG
jgi:hypothetical protein